MPIKSASELPKIRLQITVREDFVKWIDVQVEKLRFASRSHAIEFALGQLLEQDNWHTITWDNYSFKLPCEIVDKLEKIKAIAERANQVP